MEVKCVSQTCTSDFSNAAERCAHARACVRWFPDIRFNNVDGLFCRVIRGVIVCHPAYHVGQLGRPGWRANAIAAAHIVTAIARSRC